MSEAKQIADNFLRGVNNTEQSLDHPISAEQWKRTAADMYAYKEILREERDAIWWRSWFQIVLAAVVGCLITLAVMRGFPSPPVP